MKRGSKQVWQRRPKRRILKLKRPREEHISQKKEESEGKEKNLKARKNLERKLLQKPLWFEDLYLLKNTGRNTKYANIRPPAEPCCPPTPKSMNTTRCISIIALGVTIASLEKLDLTSTFELNMKRLYWELLGMQTMLL